MSDPSQLFGLLTLDPPLYCARETLGTCNYVRIGGVAGKLTLPGLPNWGNDPADPLHTPLVPPTAAVGWKRGTPLRWGRPESYPTGVGSVHLALLDFDVQDSQRNAAGADILRGFDEWRTLFINHLELITKQRRGPSIEVHNKTDDLDLFYWSDRKAMSDFDKEPTSITIYVRPDSYYLTSTQLRVACELSSTGSALPLEYRILLESYRANARGDYRTAVIHAASATEIALTNSIRAKLAEDGIVYADKLLAKFRMLAGRFELAQIVGVTLPSIDFKHDLIQPRNDVIHKADVAGLSTATSAIKAADAVIDGQPSALYAKRI